MKRFISLSAIGALAFSQIVGAAITVSPTGYYMPTGNAVTINAQAAPNGTAFIIEAEPGDSIGDIVVNTPNNPSHRVFLEIRNKGTQANNFNTTIGVDGVRSLQRGTGTGEVWLDDVFIRGELGFLTPEGVPTGLVKVNVVRGTITVRRNILADIEAIGTFEFTAPSGKVINAIVVPEDLLPPNELCLGCDSNDRSITGSIRALNGGIGSINAHNELGLVDEQIVSQGPVGSITAGSLPESPSPSRATTSAP